MAKYSVTGQQSGCSDLPLIVPVEEKYQTVFGKTANDCLRRHRAAQEGISLDSPTRPMIRGNVWEDATRDFWIEEFGLHVDHPDHGFKDKTANLVASLDGLMEDVSKFAITDFRGVTHVLNGRGALEIKIPGYKSDDPLTHSRYLQVQGQMACADLDWVIIAELPTVTFEWNMAVCYRHKGTIDRIREAVGIFWAYMENDADYPPITSTEASRLIGGNRSKEVIDFSNGWSEGSPISEDDAETLNDLVHEYQIAEQKLKEGKDQKEQATLDIQNILGPVERVAMPEASVYWTTVDVKSKPAVATVPLTDDLPIEHADIVRKIAKKIAEPRSSKLSRRFQIR